MGFPDVNSVEGGLQWQIGGNLNVGLPRSRTDRNMVKPFGVQKNHISTRETEHHNSPQSGAGLNVSLGTSSLADGCLDLEGKNTSPTVMSTDQKASP